MLCSIETMSCSIETMLCSIETTSCSIETMSCSIETMLSLFFLLSNIYLKKQVSFASEADALDYIERMIESDS